ncbi:hypothetical protein D3C80_881800 [compost metagenome]
MTVIGPPVAICFLNSGTTEPEEPNTLPKRTILICVFGFVEAKPWQYNSAMRFDAPMTLVGRTALSVEIKTKVSTP